MVTPKLKIEVIPMAEVPLGDARGEFLKHRPVVLVVDDEKIIADTLTIILSKSGFSAMTAYDGIKGLEIAERIRPELVISDVVMPGMTGVELAIALAQTVPECKILLFSGQAATVDLLERARSAGHHFTTLAKPVHPTQLLKHISEFLTVPAMSSLSSIKVPELAAY